MANLDHLWVCSCKEEFKTLYELVNHSRSHASDSFIRASKTLLLTFRNINHDKDTPVLVPRAM